MIDNKQKFKLAVNSTLGLLISIVLFVLLQRGFVYAGVFISGYKGQIEWEVFNLIARYDAWSRRHVLALYLLPYLGLWFVFLILSKISKKHFASPLLLNLIYNWSYLVLLVWLFFLPLWEVFYKKGVYFALSWAGFSRIEQFLFAFLMMVFYFTYFFKVSALFSYDLMLPVKRYVLKTQISQQLIFLWYLPVAILSIILFVLSGMNISFPNSYFIDGVFITIVINTLYIRSYKVIIR